MQHSDYTQHRQQAAVLAAAMFGSIVAAVLVSTFIIMSLMRGEMASALAYAQPTVAQTASAGTCTSPSDTQGAAVLPASGEGSDLVNHGVWAAGTHHAAGGYGSASWKPMAHKPTSVAPAATVTNSYNSSHVSNNSTSNSNTSHVTTNVTDSYNGLNNGNTTTTNTSVNTNVNTNLNSNNTDNSDNSTTTTTNTTLTATDNSTNTDNSQVLSNNDLLSNNTAVILPLVPVL